jgi:ATP phosphoribosyltransferase regulatory subunit
MASNDQVLLPAGLADLLPPDAEREEATSRALVDVFHSHGYESVRPPLLEFEDSLTAGLGAAGAGSTFRLMDPHSQRMLGVRADITPQIARIASTRLAAADRPLRLCYAGDVLRVNASANRGERQVRQIGAELIGCPGADADVEILLLTIEALGTLGIEYFTIDLTCPNLVPAVMESSALEPELQTELEDALRRKNVSTLRSLSGDSPRILAELAAAAGPVEEAETRLRSIDLPARAAEVRDRTLDVLGRLRSLAPEVALTLDPVENRGFGYYAGVGFAVFAPGARREIAFGGRYRISPEETAFGVSFFTDSLLRVAAGPVPARRVLVSRAADPAVAAGLRRDGWIAIVDLLGSGDVEAARRARCTHVLRDGAPVPLLPESG